MSAQPSELPAALLTEIGDILAELGSTAENIGTALCLEPIVVERFHDKLQFFDQLTQTLHELSEVLKADDPSAKVGHIRLDELQERLAFASAVEAEEPA